MPVVTTGMNAEITIRLDMVCEALAAARAVIACFRVDAPELVAAIEAALAEADALKRRAILSS